MTPESAESPAALVCPAGCGAPVVRGVPRFVNSSNYASGFGLQWKTFRRTQLDSYTGATVSRDRLTRCFGGPLDMRRGKSVPAVGCGAGRFTELMLGAGAQVFAGDLSQAIEDCLRSCGLVELEVSYAGNGVEARAGVPAAQFARGAQASA